jgi:transcription-repair coupling factor (superfamily II helicase)
MKSETLKKIVDIRSFDEVIKKILQLNPHANALFCSPLYGVSKSLFIRRLNEIENQIVLLLPDSKTAEEIFIESTLLGIEEQIILLADFTRESVQEKLTKISRMKKFVLISTYELLTIKLPEKERVEKTTTIIQAGGNFSYAELLEYLNLLNYQRDNFVEAPGEFSVRGSIIDFWSYSEHNPVRIEFDGDFLESIRHFDPESQRSIEKLESTTLAGAINNEAELTAEIFSYLNNPIVLASSFELQQKAFHPTLDKHEEFNDQNSSIVERESGNEFPEFENTLSTENSSFKINLDQLLKKENSIWILEEEIASSPDRIELGFSEAPIINSNFQILFGVLKDYSQKNYDVIITSENELQTSRLKELLSEFNGELSTLIESRKIKLETLPIKQGFVHNKEKILLLTDYQIFNKPYRSKLPQKKYRKSKSRQLFQ